MQGAMWAAGMAVGQVVSACSDAYGELILFVKFLKKRPLVSSNGGGGDRGGRSGSGTVNVVRGVVVLWWM
jgi:hypothetical protein